MILQIVEVGDDKSGAAHGMDVHKVQCLLQLLTVKRLIVLITRRMSDFHPAAKSEDHRRTQELHESLRFWVTWMQLRARATIGEFTLAPMSVPGPKHWTLSPPSKLEHTLSSNEIVHSID